MNVPPPLDSDDSALLSEAHQVEVRNAHRLETVGTPDLFHFTMRPSDTTQNPPIPPRGTSPGIGRPVGVVR